MVNKQWNEIHGKEYSVLRNQCRFQVIEPSLYEASPPCRAGVLPYGSASQPGKENNKHFHIAPLDPVLKDGRSALRQHFVRGERAGQLVKRYRMQT